MNSSFNLGIFAINYNFLNFSAISAASAVALAAISSATFNSILKYYLCCSNLQG